MNKLLMGVFALVAVLGTGMIFLQQQNITELRGEVMGLRRDMAERVRPRDESNDPDLRRLLNEALKVAADQRVELAKLRADVAAVQISTQNVVRQAQAATQAARGESPVPVKLTPASELKNVGRATATAAVETVLAAAFGGDVETLASSIALDSAATALAQEMLARLPEATRAEYGSPDKLIALMLAKDAAALTGMQVLGQRDISPDVVGVRVRFSNEEGKTKEQGFGFRKTPDGLKMIITEEVVKKYAGQLGGKE